MLNWLKKSHPHSDPLPQAIEVNAMAAEPAIQNDAQHEVNALKSMGDNHFAEGRLKEAVAYYQQAISINPNFAEVYSNLGNVFREQGLYTEAEQSLKTAITIKPEMANAYYNLGSLLLEIGRADEAIVQLDKGLSLKPDAEIIYRDLALAFVQTGQFKAARQVTVKGIAHNANFADFHSFMGNLHLHENELDLAVECYQRALSIQPDYAEALANLGKVFLAQGKLEDALICSRRAMKLQPSIVDLHFSLALSCQQNGNSSDAMDCYREILAVKPDNASAHCNMGVLFQEQDNLDEAIDCYQKALSLNPDLIDANCNLGIALVRVDRGDEAIACFRRVLDLNPEFYAAQANWLRELQKKCNWEQLEPGTQTLRHAVLHAANTANNRVDPFVFLALSGTTAAEQKLCAEKLVQRVFSPLDALRNKLSFDHHRDRNEKIKIGYLSADFRNHPVSYLMAEIIELHDRNRFHISAYSYGPDDYTPMRRRLENSFDNFIDIQNDTLEDAARIIYADHIDILIDLTGYTFNSRSAILALRPAPIQVNYLGYPGTMGADFVDYLIADHFVIPPNDQKHYSENIIRMPDCFMPNDRSRPQLPAPSRKACGLPVDCIIFCCFNQTYKITPEIFDIWCRLLNAVPGSVLWLPASTEQAESNLKQEAKIRGVAAERIMMAPRLPKIEDHLARLQCADLFLDTNPFNAHTTCSDALWMGLPVITCAGDTFPSRVAGSLLTAIGVPELITYNLEDYYQLALGLATDRKKLEAIRNKIIANRNTSPLFDSTRFTRNLEQAFMDMKIRHNNQQET